MAAPEPVFFLKGGRGSTTPLLLLLLLLLFSSSYSSQSGVSIPQRRSLLDALGYKGRTPIGNASGLGVVLYIATYSYATVRVETWHRPGPVAISFTYPGLASCALVSLGFRIWVLGFWLMLRLKIEKKENCARNWKGTLANSLKNL